MTGVAGLRITFSGMTLLHAKVDVPALTSFKKITLHGYVLNQYSIQKENVFNIWIRGVEERKLYNSILQICLNYVTSMCPSYSEL
jgi:hypothetical protein